MDEERIAKIIEETLMNAGYGKRAAKMAASPIATEVFYVAYELGKLEMKNKLGFLDAVSELK